MLRIKEEKAAAIRSALRLAFDILDEGLEPSRSPKGDQRPPSPRPKSRDTSAQAH